MEKFCAKPFRVKTETLDTKLSWIKLQENVKSSVVLPLSMCGALQIIKVNTRTVICVLSLVAVV